jgi:hypothetical protein
MTHTIYGPKPQAIHYFGTSTNYFLRHPYRLASTTIERHLKVQGAANPYDAHYTEYFEKRRCFAWRVRWASRPASTASATQA